MSKNIMSFGQSVQTAFDADQAKFTAFCKMMVDYAKDELEAGISKKEANAQIVSRFRQILGCDENSTNQEIRRAIRRHQVEIFEIIEETVQDILVHGWMNDPFFQRYVDVRNLALGDKNEFYVEDDSILTIAEFAGNHHDVIRQRVGAGRVTSIQTKWLTAKVYAEFERLVTNVDDFGKLITKITEAYNRYVYQMIYDTLVSFSNGLAAPFKKTGSITATDLRALIDTVKMATGSEVVIMGSHTALANVRALTGIDYLSTNMKDELYKTGVLSFFEGTPLVEVKNQFKDRTMTTQLISNTMIWIMPVADEKFIKLVNEGAAMVKSVNDSDTNMDMTYEYEVAEKIGCGIILQSKFGVYNTVTG